MNFLAEQEKMDLLRQIWLRAPLSTFSAVSEALGDQSDDWFRQRNRIVNRLPGFDRYMERFFLVTGGRLSAYVLLSVLQGDWMPDSSGYINPQYLAARAAFLRDPKMYEEACLRGAYTYGIFSLDLALISDVPEIQAWALALTDDPWEISDPEIIRWTPQLIRYYDKLPISWSSTRSRYIPGYLHIYRSSVVMKDEYYLAGYLRREVVNGAEALLENTSADVLLRICISSGYLSPRIYNQGDRLMIAALEYVLPSWVMHLPKISLDVWSISVGLSVEITLDFVERARQMIPLIEQYYPSKQNYLNQLRVICGQRIDLVPSKSMETLMTQVAHPQLKKMASVVIRSSVFYDLPNSIRTEKFPMPMEVLLAYATGRILEVYPLDDPEWDKKLLGIVTPGNYRVSGDIEAKYRQTLAIFRG